MNDNKFYKITDLDLLENELKKKFSIQKIADYCQISRQQLYKRMKKLNIITRDLKTDFNYVKRLIAYDSQYFRLEILERHLGKLKSAIMLSERNENISVNIDYKKELKDIIDFMSSTSKL